ncbi:hypothetical protein GCM10009546_02860 [Actinomadura livida]|uniref:Uncharacterized protein n=1 Tax=Actinomadura livida TaxID=79909 RepID=A0ABN1DIC1_9ACTN|nr:hypothetical protein GCM10010208_29100 [Actinomadura livida]
MHDRTNTSTVRAVTPILERPHNHDQVQHPTPETTITTTPAPWARDVDPERAVAEIGDQFPSATIWFGEYTGSFWALTYAQDGTPRLIEGATPQELSRRLDSLMPHPAQHRRPQPPSRRAVHGSAAPYLPPAARASVRSRRLRKRNECRGRHSMPKTLGRSR